MSSDHWKVKVVSRKWKWPVSAILIKIRLPSWAVLVQETPSKSLRCKIRWMDVKIIINPRKSTDWNFPLRNIHCFTSWSWFPAILLSQHKSKDQKRGSTKYCFALVRNVGAGLTNHPRYCADLPLLCHLCCVQGFPHFNLKLQTSQANQLPILRVRLLKWTFSTFCLRPRVGLLWPCSPRFRIWGGHHREPLSQVAINTEIVIGEESLKRKHSFGQSPNYLSPPSLPPPNSGTLVNFFKHQKHWSKWPSLPSIPQRPMPKCPGWLNKMGFSSTLQLWSSSWSGSSVTRSTPGSLPSWFPSTRTRNLAFTPQR